MQIYRRSRLTKELKKLKALVSTIKLLLQYKFKNIVD